MKSPGVLLAAALASAACTSPDSVPSSTSQASGAASPVTVGAATLTEDGCAFVQAAAAAAGGSFTITVRNRTPDGAGFDLYLLHPDVSYVEWVAYNAAAQASFEAGGEGPGDPVSIADPVDLQIAVDAGQAGTAEVSSAVAGSYALQCWQFAIEGVGHLWSAGPITIQ